MYGEAKVCPYSVWSLEFYLLVPIYAFSPSIVLIGPLLLFLPYLFVYCLAKYAPGRITPMETNHPIYRDNFDTFLHAMARSFLLGLALTLGIKILNLEDQTPNLSPLGLYFCLLSLFHFSEYFVTSLTNPNTLDASSFLLGNSIAYGLAISMSVLEYILEYRFFPGQKSFDAISKFGLFLSIFGEMIRKLAMFTAGKNFTHSIAYKKRPDHQLVTHGIYSYFRHPSYAGWFYWAIGTQILLRNPVSLMIFIALTYKFFKDRIAYEELLLVNFFGDQYKRYQERVGLWMPIL